MIILMCMQCFWKNKKYKKKKTCYVRSYENVNNGNLRLADRKTRETKNPDNNWEAMKVQLNFRFADVVDGAQTLSLLKKLRQGLQNVAIYRERCQSIAEDAFRGITGSLDSVMKQVVNCFIEGLNDDQFKVRLYRDVPVILQEAVTLAMKEYQIKKLVTGGESLLAKSQDFQMPMEVDHARPSRFRDTREPSRREPMRFRRREPPRPVHAVHNNKNNITCWGCGQRGHYQSECPNHITDRSRQNTTQNTGHPERKGRGQPQVGN